MFTLSPLSFFPSPVQRGWRSHASRSRAEARALAVIRTATAWNQLPPPAKKKFTYLSRYKSAAPLAPPLPPLRPLPPLMKQAMLLKRKSTAAAAAAVCLVCAVRCLRARRLHGVLAATAAETARGPQATAIQRIVRGRIGRVRVRAHP